MSDVQEEEIQPQKDPPQTQQNDNAELIIQPPIQSSGVGAAVAEEKSATAPPAQKKSSPPQEKNSPPNPPHTRYGPKANKGPVKIAKKDPRIDPVKYQFVPKKKNDGVGACDLDVDANISGVVLWQADRLSEKDVDEYLAFVERLLPDKQKFYSEERSLFLLHLCEYDISHAKLVLREKSSIQASNVASDMSESEESTDQNSEPDLCFVCGDGGNLLICDAPNCNKVYHLHCVDLEDVPSGSWQCNWHSCMVCADLADLRYTCRYCPNSLCSEHGKTEDLPLCQQVEYLCKTCRDDNKNLTPDNRFYLRLSEFNRRSHRKENVRTKKIGRTQISLYALFSQVATRGGFKEVNGHKQWNAVHRALRLDSGVKHKHLRKFYQNHLLPYELHFQPPEPAPPLLQTKIGSFNGGVVDLTGSDPPVIIATPPPVTNVQMIDMSSPN